MKRRSLLAVPVLWAGMKTGLRAGEPAASRPPARTRSPALEIGPVDGTLVRISELTGKVVLLDFMTTVCPTCKVASAGIQKLYEEFGGQGFRPVAIALNAGTPAPLAEYRREFGLTFPLGAVSREHVLAYLDHPADKPLYVPTIVLLDRRGRICSVEVGWRGEEALRAAVAKLLSER